MLSNTFCLFAFTSLLWILPDIWRHNFISLHTPKITLFLFRCFSSPFYFLNEIYWNIWQRVIRNRLYIPWFNVSSGYHKYFHFLHLPLKVDINWIVCVNFLFWISSFYYYYYTIVWQHICDIIKLSDTCYIISLSIANNKNVKYVLKYTYTLLKHFQLLIFRMSFLKL